MLLPSIGRSPRFALWVILAYALLLLPSLIASKFDPSVFIWAGDRYVQSDRLASPIIVRPGSDGYDGEFYYRLALDPFDLARTAHGITLDGVAWRAQRIGYPVIVWLLSFGQTPAVPLLLLLVNLAGLAVIAESLRRLARDEASPGWLPVVVMLWPGFIITMMHDTTEIASEAFLVLAFLCHRRGWRAAYVALAAGAMLTREVTALFFVGLFLAAVLEPGDARRRLTRTVPYLLPFLPFALWREALPLLTDDASLPAGAQNLGWPFVGAAQNLVDCLTGARPWASTPVKDAVMRVLVLITALGLFGFCAVVAIRLSAAWRRPQARGLALSWVLLAALMSLLTAGGPWIDPVGIFRAFTECYVVGCLLIAFGPSPPPLGRSFALVGTGLFLAGWALCVFQLR